MSHFVHHTDASGASHLDDVGSLEAALARVEELADEVEHGQVRVLREIPIQVRTYHKAVVLDDDVASSSGPTEEAEGDGHAEPPPGAMPLAPPPVTVRGDLDEDGEGGGSRSRIFSRH